MNLFGLRRRRLLTIPIAAVMATSVYAFTASNTMPASAPAAGDGSSAISGYTVSSVAYTLNGTSPQNIDQVAFSLGGVAATTVKARLSAGGSWYSCTAPVSPSVTWTCTTTSPQATVSAASQLQVIAAQ